VDLEGALVQAVEPQSPAAQAGLVKGDIITTANGVRIRSPSQFRNFVGLTPVGKQIDLQLRRGKEIVAVTVQIEPLKHKRSDQHARSN
jgi:S1-C subfamily serine protease